MKSSWWIMGLTWDAFPECNGQRWKEWVNMKEKIETGKLRMKSKDRAGVSEENAEVKQKQ